MARVIPHVSRGSLSAHFSRPFENPLEAVERLYNDRPPLASPEQAFLIHGAGRTGWGVARMAARAPGNEEMLIMLLPRDIPGWYRLEVLNHNRPTLAEGVIINPEGEKQIHILPPRDVEAKLAQLEQKVRDGNEGLRLVLSWAKKKLSGRRGEVLKQVTSYWLAAAQFQAVTTRVGDMAGAIDPDFIRRLHPEGHYVLWHPSKSMAAPRPETDKPLFGHELLQALLQEGGRGDLTSLVVASGGYWVDKNVRDRNSIRVCFASESQEALDAAKRVVGGIDGGYDLLSISGAVGAAAVFLIQFGGCGKNFFLANILGDKAARKAASLSGQEPDFDALETNYLRERAGLIDETQQLAARVMKHEGLGDFGKSVRFPAEVMEDIYACTTLNWPALVARANELHLLSLRTRVGTLLGEEEIAVIRAGLSTFFKSAPESHFGTTNMTGAIVFGTATALVQSSLIRSLWEVIDRAVIKPPEGIKLTLYVVQRFGPAGLAQVFEDAIVRFQPFLQGPG